MSTPDRTTKKWFAVKTKFKTEKFVVNQLSKKNIEAYVPLIKSTKRYGRKIKKLEIPLINCYAFVYTSLENKTKVLETEYVYSFVGQTGRIESIPQHEIDLLKRVVGEFEGSLDVNPIDWIPGTEVEIISGSLTGLTGKMVSRSGKSNFIIELTSLGVQLQMEIDKKLLRKLPKVA